VGSYAAGVESGPARPVVKRPGTMTNTTSAEDLLDEVFEDFLTGTIVRTKTACLGRLISIDNVDLLARKLVSIGDVHDYIDDAETTVPALEFFLFVDLISSLVLALGPTGVESFQASADPATPYTAWVAKYVSDDRFHDELRASFPEVFAGR
jgi:hypothetical protein